MQSPIVILIRPQLGENIGAVARAMANFGLSELRIVSPRDGWPNAAAESMASSNGIGIIQAAKIFASVADAMLDITRAYATTARLRDIHKPALIPSEAIGEMRGLLVNAEHKVALVFGPERTGLTNEDISWCATLITIPTTEHASLNIAQSMVILGYEWHVANGGALPEAEAEDPATLASYEHLFKQLEAYLDRSDFFKAEGKKPTMMLNIKTMLLNGHWSKQELRTFYGMVKALAENLR